MLVAGDTSGRSTGVGGPQFVGEVAGPCSSALRHRAAVIGSCRAQAAISRRSRTQRLWVTLMRRASGTAVPFGDRQPIVAGR